MTGGERRGSFVVAATMIAALAFAFGCAVGFTAGWWASPNQRHGVPEICAAWPESNGTPRPAYWRLDVPGIPAPYARGVCPKEGD